MSINDVDQQIAAKDAEIEKLGNNKRYFINEFIEKEIVEFLLLLTIFLSGFTLGLIFVVFNSI